MRPSIGDQCQNRWRAILPQMGIASSFLTGKQTPCPICGGKDRFRFDDKDGRGTSFCNQCGAFDGVKLVMAKNGWSFQDAAQRIREVVPGCSEIAPRPAPTAEARMSAMRSIWKESRKVTLENDAGRYLVARGIEPPFSDVLRFVPRLRVTGEKVKELSAMIALVRDPKGNPLTLHRTYLEGPAKANISSPRRLMAGDTPHGSYIELWPADEEMACAEGIETALRVQQRFGIPCWSLISADGMKAFDPPSICRKLWIFGDNDPKFGGQAASYALAHRLACRRGIEVHVEIPPQTGTDWADAA